MKKVKTSSGFEYEIDEENLNDMRLSILSRRFRTETQRNCR